MTANGSEDGQLIKYIMTTFFEFPIPLPLSLYVIKEL